MRITEAICSGNRRYKAAEKLTPQGVVLHSIGTPQPSADVLLYVWHCFRRKMDLISSFRCVLQSWKSSQEISVFREG